MPADPQRVPMRPQHHRAMPRNWSAEPEQRMLSNLAYQRTRYGQGMSAPQSYMVRNLRQQGQFRRPE